jgi:hypothetical protein
MICTYKQLFIVIDPILTDKFGWEYDIEPVLQLHIQEYNRRQTIQTIVGQERVRELFTSNSVSDSAVFLFTHANSDLVILVNKYLKQCGIESYRVGFWRYGYAANTRYNKLNERHWWRTFDLSCAQGLDKVMFIDNSYKYEFARTVFKKQLPWTIIKFPLPVSVAVDRLSNIIPLEFKTNLIAIDTDVNIPMWNKLLPILATELPDFSFTLVRDTNVADRIEYTKTLMNAKYVIRPEVGTDIGDEIYQYIAFNCIPICSVRNFGQNIVPSNYVIKQEWFKDLLTSLEHIHIVVGMIKEFESKYQHHISKIQYLDKKLKTVFFSSDKFISKFY